MNEERSARLALPLLQPGQAQKDMTHNEALALLDIVTAAGVAAAGVNVPPAAPEEGACWIVGTAPEGAWAGHAEALAGWTAGGWRFIAPRDGICVWNAATRRVVRYLGGAWEEGIVRGSEVRVDGVRVVGAQRGTIAAPSGGATVDMEARAGISAILAALRGHGLIAT